MPIKIFDGTVPDGERGDGCLPHVPGIVASLPPLEDDWLYTDEEIAVRLLACKDIVLERANRTPWIYQGQQGSCCPSTYGHVTMQLNAGEGEYPVKLSQASLYAWDGFKYGAKEPYSLDDLIPRRSDHGMAMRTGIMLARFLGMAPVDVIDPKDWQRRNWPANWQKMASPHRVVEWRNVSESLWALDSALARPCPVAHGYAGHARCIIWKDPKSGIYHCKNSWQSEPWHFLTADQVRRGQRDYEAFAAITTVAA
jgi:hypothetical protein